MNLSVSNQLKSFEDSLFRGEVPQLAPFPSYAPHDTYGSAKGLEAKLLGQAPEAMRLDEGSYAHLLAQALKSLPDNPEWGQKPGGKDIFKFLTRSKVQEVFKVQGGKNILEDSLNPRQQQIQQWFHLALTQLRNKLSEPAHFRKEMAALRENQELAPTAFAWRLKERFELLADLRADPKRQFLRGWAMLIDMDPQEYEKTSLAEKITQDQLKVFYCQAFGLIEIPEGRLEGLVSQPHLDAERWEEGLVSLEESMAQIPGFRSALDEFCDGLFSPEVGGLRLNFYSAADTLLDYAGGVDAVVEVVDAEGRVVERLLIDITTNPQALAGKITKMRRGHSLANHLFLFKRDGILPIEDDPSLPRVLQEGNFRGLLDRLSYLRVSQRLLQ